MDVAERYHAIKAQCYPWFDASWQRIFALHQVQRLPHALIINGAAGTGKMDFAGFLAAAVLCQHSDQRGACGQCRSCALLESSGHPDLFHLHPEEGAAQIKVDQVRELAKFMQSTAQQGGYRVVVLEPAESMNIAASNALLKTLEEPGKNSLILLLSHQLGQVMPTIKSRCQRVDCPVPSSNVVVPWLCESLKMDAADAQKLLNIVHGSPLRALHFKREGGQALRADFFVSLKSVLQGKLGALEMSSALMKQDLVMHLAWFYSLLVDVVKLGQVGESAELSNADMSNMIAALSKRCSSVALYGLIDKIQQQRTSLMLHQNPNKQLMLEELLLDWKNLIKSD